LFSVVAVYPGVKRDQSKAGLITDSSQLEGTINKRSLVTHTWTNHKKAIFETTLLLNGLGTVQYPSLTRFMNHGA